MTASAEMDQPQPWCSFGAALWDWCWLVTTSMCVSSGRVGQLSPREMLAMWILPVKYLGLYTCSLGEGPGLRVVDRKTA
jgi:hypothetical protein